MVRKKSVLISFFLLLTVFCSYAQDTISLMAYNLLKYSSINQNRNRYLDLRKVVQETKPDILMVCELLETSAAQFLLDSAVNAAGIGTYSRAAVFDGPDTDNMLYYNTQKVTFRSQKQIITVLRDISQYVVYKTISPGDTAFLYLHMAHLKAGNTSADENQRNSEISAFCSAVSTLPSRANVIIAGDFNLKSNTEPAWYTLTNTCSHVMYDPIDQQGYWNNNSDYSAIHTQSTRSSGFNGCCGGATGGLDDRFDFIMHNINVKEGKSRVRYVNGSYVAVGNDNLHFNKSIIEAPANAVVSPALSQALFNMSDHLPVMMKLEISSELNSVEEWVSRKKLNVKPLSSNNIIIETGIDGTHTIDIMNLSGQLIYTNSENFRPGTHQINLNDKVLPNNMYIITVGTESAVKRIKYISSGD